MASRTVTHATAPGFLEDWKPDHRPLSDEQRAHVGGYIQAIVRRGDPEARGVEAVAAEARDLWIGFRETFDDLRGEFVRSENEDVGRALARI
jgi:hypothetical protein